MDNPTLHRLLSAAGKFDASDLHLVAGVPPAFRVNGGIVLAEEDALNETELEQNRTEPAQQPAAKEVRAGMGTLHLPVAQRRRPRSGYLLPAQRPP